MNVEITRATFEALPFRDEADEYVKNAWYRARGDANGVYQWKGAPHYPLWWSFSVTFGLNDDIPAPL